MNKPMTLSDFFSQFPNHHHHVDFEPAPKPFYFELPKEMEGVHKGLDIVKHRKIMGGLSQEHINVSPDKHKVEYDRTTVKHLVKGGK